jgi:hypothetical protein
MFAGGHRRGLPCRAVICLESSTLFVYFFESLPTLSFCPQLCSIESLRREMMDGMRRWLSRMSLLVGTKLRMRYKIPLQDAAAAAAAHNSEPSVLTEGLSLMDMTLNPKP